MPYICSCEQGHHFLFYQGLELVQDLCRSRQRDPTPQGDLWTQKAWAKLPAAWRKGLNFINCIFLSNGYDSTLLHTLLQGLKFSNTAVCTLTMRHASNNVCQSVLPLCKHHSAYFYNLDGAGWTLDAIKRCGKFRTVEATSRVTYKLFYTFFFIHRSIF